MDSFFGWKFSFNSKVVNTLVKTQVRPKEENRRQYKRMATTVNETMSERLITIGNFTIDNIVTADGLVSSRKAGGNAVFSAIGAHLWANEVAIFTTIPNNYPSNYLEELERGGIYLKGVKKVGPPVNSEEWFFYNSDGSRTDRLFASNIHGLPIRPAGYLIKPEERAELIEGKNKGFEPEVSFFDFRKANPLSIDVIDYAANPARACHIAPNLMAGQWSIASGLKAHGVLISLDPPLLRAPVPESELEGLLACVDCFLPSLIELNGLYPDLEPEDAIRRLSRFGSVAIGVKLGAQGSLVWSKRTGKIAHIPAYPTTCVVDLTGAGDAYCGGFLAGMLETGDPWIAAKYGTVTASLMIEKPDLPSKLMCSRNQAIERLKKMMALPDMIL
jgi:sugar/nucleoside kinase (ribokinase family)